VADIAGARDGVYDRGDDTGLHRDWRRAVRWQDRLMPKICYGLNCTSTKLVNAHIIAKGFGRLLRGSGSNVSITPSNVGTAKQQLGEFDSEILCADCDGILGRFDDYAMELCQKFEQLHTKPQPEVFELPHSDRELFGKFALSVLWRASISRRPSVAEVRLGPYEMKLRDVIFSSQSIDELPEAEIILQRYTVQGNVDPAGHYFYPTRFKMADLNFYNFAVAGFRIRTKVDSRPLPTELRPFSLSSGRFIGTFALLEETSEFQQIINLMRRRERRR
jgi:hypothetical protein